MGGGGKAKERLEPARVAEHRRSNIGPLNPNTDPPVCFDPSSPQFEF